MHNSAIRRQAKSSMNIVPTRRFYFALLLVLAVVIILRFLLPAPQAVSSYQLFVILDLLVVALVSLDIFSTPNKKILSAKREMGHRFSIGRENAVTITVENLAGKSSALPSH